MWLEYKDVTEVQAPNGRWLRGINVAPGMKVRTRRIALRVWDSPARTFHLFSNRLRSCR